MTVPSPGHRDRVAPAATAPDRRLRLVAIASTTGVSVAAAGVAFVVNILMARELGPSSRGQVAIVLQSAYVVAPLLALGVDRQALRGADAAGGVPRSRHLWLAALVLAAGGAAFQSLTVTACVAIAAATAYLNIQRGVGMAQRSLLRFVLLSLGMQTWILAASVGLFVTHVTDVRWWLAVYVAPAPFLLLEALVTRRSTATLVGPSRKSLAYMVGGLASMLAGRVERLLLPVLASTQQLGLYMAVATTSEMIAWAAKGLGESRVQDYVDRTMSRRQMALLAAKDATWFLAAAVPVAAILYLVVIPLLGPSFSSTRSLVIPLCLSSAAWCVYLQMSSRWLGAGSSTRSVSLDVATTAVTTVLVLVLVPDHGALGAGYACLAAYSIMSVVAVVLRPQSDSRPTTAPADGARGRGWARPAPRHRGEPRRRG